MSIRSRAGSLESSDSDRGSLIDADIADSIVSRFMVDLSRSNLEALELEKGEATGEVFTAEVEATKVQNPFTDINIVDSSIQDGLSIFRASASTHNLIDPCLLNDRSLIDHSNTNTRVTLLCSFGVPTCFGTTVSVANNAIATFYLNMLRALTEGPLLHSCGITPCLCIGFMKYLSKQEIYCKVLIIRLT